MGAGLSSGSVEAQGTFIPDYTLMKRVDYNGTGTQVSTVPAGKKWVILGACSLTTVTCYIYATLVSGGGGSVRIIENDTADGTVRSFVPPLLLRATDTVTIGGNDGSFTYVEFDA